MNATTFHAFSDELEKIAVHQMHKEAIYETLRVGGKAIKQALLGGTKLTAKPGAFAAQRKAAVTAGDTLMGGLKGSGLKVHRARVKSPGSLTSGGHKTVPDDLLGMQLYGEGPKDVGRVQEALKAHGATLSETTAVVRPGYHGVNIKAQYQGTPLEVQISPGRMSNVGQMIEHSLAYKPKIEAPRSNFIDRWVGKKVAPKMVSGASWVPQYANRMSSSRGSGRQ